MRKYQARKMQYRIRQTINSMEMSKNIIVSLERGIHGDFALRITSGYENAMDVAHLIAWLPMPKKVIDVDGMLNVMWR